MTTPIKKLPIKECLATLKWLGKIDPKAIPRDILPADLRTKAKSILLDFKEFKFQKDLGQAVSEEMFRLCPGSWDDPLSDVGSDYANTRFNYRGVDGRFKVRVLYFGRPDTTTFVEKFQNESLWDDPEFTPEDYVLHKYQVALKNVLVLDSEVVAGRLGISLAVVLNEWSNFNVEYELPSPSQVLGYIVKNLGYDAMLFRSTRFSLGRNLVVFTENASQFKPRHLGSTKVDFASFRKRLVGEV